MATTTLMSHSATEMSSDITSSMAALTTNENTNMDEKLLYKIVTFLYTYVYVIIITAGVICNIFCMIILSRPTIRQTSVSLYLLVLAVTDSLVLILDFLNNFFHGVLSNPIIGINKITCNLYMFFFNVAFTYSSWLVVAITFERTLAVSIPMKAIIIMSRKKAKIISCVILLMVAGFLSFNLAAWDSTESDRNCNWAKGWESFHQNTNMWLMGFSYSYTPSIIILICNTLIVYKLSKASKTRKEMKQNQVQEGSKSDTTKITITVFLVSVAFLLLTAPMSAYYLFQFATGETIDQTPEMALGEATMLMLGLANHGINFWIYIISSAQYRKAFLNIWSICRKKNKGRETKYVSNTASTVVNNKDGSGAGSKNFEESINTIS